MIDCSSVPRPGQDGTWITEDLEKGYCELIRRGSAHSFEAWQGGKLVGGFYGVAIGPCFFGESMFVRVPDASKCAFATFAKRMFEMDATLLSRWNAKVRDDDTVYILGPCESL